MRNPEQNSAPSPVSPEDIGAYYELLAALLRNSESQEEVLLQKVLQLHVEDPEAFEWHAQQLAEFRKDSLAKTQLSTDEFETAWAQKVTEQPSVVLRELERWRTAKKEASGNFSVERRLEIESAFPEYAMQHHTELMVGLLVSKGLDYKQATFVMFMRRHIDESTFLQHSLTTALYRSEIISRLVRDGETHAMAEQLWQDWVQDDPEAIYINAIDLQISLGSSQDQWLVQPSS